MESEYPALIRRYRLCTAGFWVSAVALGLLVLSEALFLWMVFTRDLGVLALMQQAAWTWAVEMPITAGALIGSYLLWGRWTDAHWQRRAGALVAMNLYDSLSWAASRFAPAGAIAANEWFLTNLSQAFGWVEFALFAGLAAEVAGHLDDRLKPDLGRTARLFAMAGLTISLLFFFGQTRWAAGWPLQPKPIAPHAEILMRLGVAFLRVACPIQVIGLCWVAGEACRRTATELVEEARADDPFADDRKGPGPWPPDQD